MKEKRKKMKKGIKGRNEDEKKGKSRGTEHLSADHLAAHGQPHPLLPGVAQGPRTEG